MTIVQNLVLALLVVSTLWAAGSAARAAEPVDPRPVDRSSAAAVAALVSAPAEVAERSVPDGFAADLGYRPVRSGDLLVDPRGGCSSVVPLPRSFTPACRRHDLGYDLLRHAAVVGRPLPPSARRALDDQLAAAMRADCPPDGGTEQTVSRVECLVWARTAAAAVRLNSWRQHESVPGRESPWTVAEGGGAAGTVGLGSALLVTVGASRRRRTRVTGMLRRLAPPLVRVAASARAVAPRVSTTLTVGVATAASVFPGLLPRSALLQGLASALFLLPALGLARRLRREAPHGGPGVRLAVVAATGAALVPVLAWAARQQDAQRALAGTDPTGARHWLAAAGVVAAVALLARGLRRLARHGRALWRPSVALVALVALAALGAPAHADDPGPAADRILLQASPLGAVRVYGEERAGESLHERAQRVADELVRRGGLERGRVVVMVPTGSGWVDPAAVQGLEERFAGDVSLVGLQYASTPSWVALVLQRGSAEQGARELVAAVHERIVRLPVGRRPALHLYGESLGALAGQAVLADPHTAPWVCSALWVGSPGGATAGRGREASVANPTDPVVHATPDLLVHPTTPGRPWLPGVSLVQAAVDLVGSRSLGEGQGHRYGPGQADHLPAC